MPKNQEFHNAMKFNFEPAKAIFKALKKRGLSVMYREFYLSRQGSLEILWWDDLREKQVSIA
jgi:hypothetical protein